MKKIIFDIDDLYNICRQRQENRFHVVMAWSGTPGIGKSTGAYRLGLHFRKIFKPNSHIVYSRKEGLPLIEKLRYGYIMDDEAIRSSYKRNFQDPEQKLLVQMLNMYRNHFNVYTLCIPKFYSLDKDLRDLIKIHLHVIDRGLAVVHIAREDVLYSDDPWDIAYNQKVEEKWAKTKKKNPNFSPPYHKLTTFAGYLRYPPLSRMQEKRYEKIKEQKRKMIYDQEIVGEANYKKEESNYKRLFEYAYNLYSTGSPMTQETLRASCNALGRDYNSVIVKMRQILKEKGIKMTMPDIFPSEEALIKMKHPLISQRIVKPRII